MDPTLSAATTTAIDSAYANRLSAARRFKKAGGKVAGFVSTAVPIEAIAAADMFPVMITGNCRGSTALADEWMESMFDPMARAIFQAALAGELEFLDVLIIPRSADSFLRLYLYLREIERLGICKQLPQIVLYDLLQTPWPSSSQHNVAQLQKLRALLRDISGSEVTDDSLRSAIAAYNQNRQLLRKVLVRRANIELTGSNALKAIATRYWLPLAEHTDLLRSVLATKTRGNAAPSKGRLVVAGNAQDNAELHQLLEAQGFDIVGDYHWLGDNCCEHDIELLADGDPWAAVSAHYHHHSLTSRRFPHLPEEIVAHARQCNAQGVVFYLFEPEEALTWDAPNQILALEAASIATLAFENQPYVIEPSAKVEAALSDLATRIASHGGVIE